MRKMVCLYCLVVVVSLWAARRSPGAVAPLDLAAEQALLSGDWVSVKTALQPRARSSGSGVDWLIVRVACMATEDYAGEMEAIVWAQGANRAGRAEWVEWAQTLAAEHSANAVAQVIRAVALDSDGNQALALAAATDATKNDERSALAHRIRGGLLANQQRYAEAVDELNRAVSLGPDRGGAYVDRASVLALQQNYEDAMKDLNRVVKLAPACPRAYLVRGVTQAAMDRRREALRDVDQAVKLAPTWAEAWVQRGNVHALQGDVEAAIEDCDKAVQLAPSAASGYVGRGGTCAMAGDDEQARSDLEVVLRLAPDGSEAEAARQFLTLVEPVRTWPPASSVGLLPARREEEEIRLPEGGVVQLSRRAWVIHDSLEVRDVRTGELFTASPTWKPGRAQFRFLTPGSLRFATEEAGRVMKVSYQYQAPRVVLVPIDIGSDYQDVAGTARGALEKAFRELGCEVINNTSNGTGEAITRSGNLPSPPPGRATIAGMARQLGAALAVSYAVNLREGESERFSLMPNPFGGPATPVPAKDTTWAAEASILIIDSTGTARAWGEQGSSFGGRSDLLWGLTDFTMPAPRKGSRRACVESAVEQAVKQLRLR